MITYLSSADVAEWFGVQPATVEKWRKRHPDFPAPDAEIGSHAGWLRERKPQIVAWYDQRPGPGAGGGRPRRVAPSD